jgi:L-asparaginase
MRPATSIAADGPANLLDAVTTARDSRACGVLVVMAGRVWAGAELRKVHSYRVDAFDAGDAGALALVEEGVLRWLREAPRHDEVLGLPRIAREASQWPRVEILTSHAGASGALVEALLAQGIDGIVAAGTGNGTLHRDLEASLLRAQAAGVQVLRCTRCAAGPVIGQTQLRAAGTLSAPQARIELLLQLLASSRPKA